MAEYFCEKCKKTLRDSMFYGSNNLEKYPEGKLNLCKNCLTMHVDNFDSSTYLWILQECDVPYVPDVWNDLLLKFGKDKSKLTGVSILGRYLSSMKLKQHKDYRWADTAFLQEVANAKKEEAMKRQGYDAQQIAQVLATGSVGVPQGDVEIPQYNDEHLINPYLASGNEDYFAMASGADEEDDFIDELTEDDKKYLRLKWGKSYKPEEWIKLEQLYDEMMNSYDIQGAGHIDTLKLVCKTSLKANQLIDVGDIDGYQKMSKVYDSLMKSGKFTAVQNKVAEGEGIDSIGELVAICEREGFIPKYYVDGPQDKADRVIEDLQRYTHDLVTNETNLDSMFESAARQMAEEQDRIAAAQDGEEDLDEEAKLFDYDSKELTDDDYQEFSDLIEQEHQMDEEMI